MTVRKAFVIVVTIAALLFMLRARMIGAALDSDRLACAAGGEAAQICTVASEARYAREAAPLISVASVGLIAFGVAYMFISRIDRRPSTRV